MAFFKMRDNMHSWGKQFSKIIQSRRESRGDSVGACGNGWEENDKCEKKNLHIDMETTDSVLGI